ncbi:MAG: hypothetical protein AAF225_11670, partial [Pseudomonadota bacterium]
ALSVWMYAELRDDVVSRVSARNREDAQFAEDQQASYLGQLEELLQQGVPVHDLPFQLIDALPEKVLRAYEDRLTGADVETDWDVWSGIMQMSDAELRRVNPMLLRADLADAEFKQLLSMQQGARDSGDFSAFTSARSFDSEAKLAYEAVYKRVGNSAGDKERYQRFRRQVDSSLRELEAGQGRKATPDERQQIFDRWMLNVAKTSRLNVFDDDDVRLFELQEGDVFSVPEEDKVLIIEALESENLPVTDGTIRQRYLMVNGLVSN